MLASRVAGKLKITESQFDRQVIKRDPVRCFIITISLGGDRQMKVTIFSTTTCPYCKMLKDYLDEKHISYSEKKVDDDEVARSEMLGLSGGFMGVPFTAVAKDDGTNDVVVGFDKARLDTILGL